MKSKLQDAKARFSELIEDTLEKGLRSSRSEGSRRQSWFLSMSGDA